VVSQPGGLECLSGQDIEEALLLLVVSPCLGAIPAKQIRWFRKQILWGQANLPDGVSIAELGEQAKRGQSDFFASSGKEVLILQGLEVGGPVARNQMSLRGCRLRLGEVPKTGAPTVGQIELVEIKVFV
jgi:hypothetical protein